MADGVNRQSVLACKYLHSWDKSNGLASNKGDRKAGDEIYKRTHSIFNGPYLLSCLRWDMTRWTHLVCTDAVVFVASALLCLELRTSKYMQ
jgi:hypothetical protein